MMNRNLVTTGACFLSLCVGFTVGLYTAKKVYERTYAELAAEEIEQAREFYTVSNRKQEFQTPEEALNALEVVGSSEALVEAATALLQYQGVELTEETTKPSVQFDMSSTGETEQRKKIGNPFVISDSNREEIDEESYVTPGFKSERRKIGEISRHNIFDESDEDEPYFDYDEEVKNRTLDKPYVITQDEYMTGELGYAQDTLTYYEGDDVLTDPQDKPIEEAELVIGDTLGRFGHGSGNHAIVYVRNDTLQMDFEVLKSNGEYAKLVLGFLEHSDKPKNPRMRPWFDA